MLVSLPMAERLKPHEEEVNILFNQVLNRYTRARGATCTYLSLFFDEDQNSILKDKIANFEVGYYVGNDGNKKCFVKTFSAKNMTEETVNSDERKKELLRIAMKEPILASYAQIKSTTSSGGLVGR
jgi:hypothetical protein